MSKCNKCERNRKEINNLKNKIKESEFSKRSILWFGMALIGLVLIDFNTPIVVKTFGGILLFIAGMTAENTNKRFGKIKYEVG
jgi:hypothetical protein